MLSLKLFWLSQFNKKSSQQTESETESNTNSLSTSRLNEKSTLYQFILNLIMLKVNHECMTLTKTFTILKLINVHDLTD